MGIQIFCVVKQEPNRLFNYLGFMFNKLSRQINVVYFDQWTWACLCQKSWKITFFIISIRACVSWSKYTTEKFLCLICSHSLVLVLIFILHFTTFTQTENIKHQKWPPYHLCQTSANGGRNSRFIIEEIFKPLVPKSIWSSMMITQNQAHAKHEF